ncbi:MAG: CatB-related O-acetyltransferase [Proteobacteria bacterium]|nr:CatB-related O-acetyltransferase [Pseudomonadota bacterium]
MHEYRIGHVNCLTREEWLRHQEKTLELSDKFPDPDAIFPVRNCKTVTQIKPTIHNPNIIVGDFTYFGDIDFEKHVTHHYDFIGDKLIIGKFCQIAAGVEFIMNGANHQMNAVTTFPFYIMNGWNMTPPPLSELPLKGDTVVGNDVWIGQNVTILPGVHIGDGAIIGANSVVGSNIPPYTIVAGNPAKTIRKRFDDELIDLLLKLRWWDKSIDEIQALIPILTCSDLEKVKKDVLTYLSRTVY